MALLVNETVFVKVEHSSYTLRARTTISEYTVEEARITRLDPEHGEFDFVLAGRENSRFGTRRIVDEGLTWSFTEQADAFRTTVALS